MGVIACLLGLVLMSPAPQADLKTAYHQAKRLEDCAGLHARFPGELTTYECYWRRGLKEGRLDDAARMLDAVVESNPDFYAAVLYLANVEADRRKERALALFEKARDGFAATNNAEGEFWAHMGFARQHYFQREMNKIAGALAGARRVADASGNRKLVVEVQLQQGWDMYRKANYAKAWTLFRQIEQDIPEGMRKNFHANVLDGLGATAWSQGRDNEAFAYYQKELEEIRPVKLLFYEADIQRNLAILSSKVTAPRKFTRDEVLAYHQEALDAAIRSGDRWREAKARLLFGETRELELEPALKADHLEKTLAFFRELKDPDFVQRTLRLLAPARLRAHPDDPGPAFELVDEAIGIASIRDMPEHVARNWIVRAQMRWMAGPRAQARAESLTALGAIEHIRERQTDPQLQARILGRFAFAFRRFAGYLLDPARGEVTGPDLDLAFQIMERMRARVLLEAVESGDRAECAELVRLRAEIAGIQKKLIDTGLDPGAREGVLFELEKLELEATAARENVCNTGRDPMSPDVIGLRDIQRELGPDQALLAFQLETEYDKEFLNKAGWYNPWGGSWLLVVSRDQARAVKIPDRGKLEAVIGMFLGLLERRDGSETRGGAKLYQWLLEEALSGLPPGIERLVVIPDGPLFMVPFGALRSGESKAPLAATYQVAVVPSASLWHRWQGSARKAPRAPAIALADPSLPRAAREAVTRGSGIFGAGLELGRLPRARDEARAVIGHLGSGSRLYLGTQATEHLLKTASLTDFGLLHLAAHAVVDDQNPQRSAVVLAAGAKEEDGLLQPPEIASLDMRGLSVILSTCSSARGEILEGEGAMSLARSFFQAGARAVVGNLWPLRDDEAADLIDDFTSHLADGKSLGAALAAAQQEWIEDGKPAAAWAGLIVQGDADLVPFPGGRSSGRIPWMMFLVVGCMVLAIVVWWAKPRTYR